MTGVCRGEEQRGCQKAAGARRHLARLERSADVHEAARRRVEADWLALLRYARRRPRSVEDIDRWVLRRMAVMGPEVAAEYERQMSRRAGTL